MIDTTDVTATVESTQRILDKMRIGSNIAIGRTTLEHMTLEMQEDRIEQQLIYQLRSFVLAQKLVEDSYEVPFTYSWAAPNSWWQMFKEEMMPKWFTDKFPVKTVVNEIRRQKTVKITRKATYPMANLSIPAKHKLHGMLGAPVIIDDVEIK